MSWNSFCLLKKIYSKWNANSSHSKFKNCSLYFLTKRLEKLIISTCVYCISQLCISVLVFVNNKYESNSCACNQFLSTGLYWENYFVFKYILKLCNIHTSFMCLNTFSDCLTHVLWNWIYASALHNLFMWLSTFMYLLIYILICQYRCTLLSCNKCKKRKQSWV